MPMNIVGIDEVGRGAWAGPLVVGAVLMNQGHQIAGLIDSKLLSKAARTSLDQSIRQIHKVGIGFVTAKEVDDLGLTAATMLASERAIAYIEVPYDEIIIDGSINYLPNNPKSRAVIKADLFIQAVSAASIVAKVARDGYMTQLAAMYPDYGFERHVGYGTKAHKLALSKYGITASHRTSFKPIRAIAV